jgi:hypothetical protein
LKEDECYRALVGTPEGERPLGTERHKWVDNIKVDLGGVVCGVIEGTDLTHDSGHWYALMKMVMKLRFP